MISCPAAPEGDRVIPVINRAQEKFDLVYATKDWHPAHHGSFAVNHAGRKPGDHIQLNGIDQILWPEHCVQDTPGAEFPERLITENIKQVFFKGTHPETDSYSAFFDNARQQSIGLDKFLKKNNINTLFLAGLATDYCVKFSALDAVELGYRTYVIENGCRGIDLMEGDVDRAFEEMKVAGVKLLRGVEIPG